MDPDSEQGFICPVPAQAGRGLGCGMMSTPDQTDANGTGPGNAGNGGPNDGHTEAPQIVISGLDEPEEQGSTDSVNVSPIDEAVNRLNAQKARGEPEDEDG